MPRGALTPAIQEQVYRIGREVLANSIYYAKATSIKAALKAATPSIAGRRCKSFRIFWCG
jgi:hypothetical protein